jgi:hypothetical protein
MIHIRVVKWREHQHYKDRNPPWIKLHRAMLSSRTWVGASNETRVLAVAIMLLASDTENLTPLDAAWIRQVAYLDFEPNFGPLLDKQFIEFVDESGKVLARCSHDASKVLSRGDTTTEAEPNPSPSLRSGDALKPDTPLPENQNPDSGDSEKAGRKRSFPKGFSVSPRVEFWAESNGFDRLAEHLEAFERKCRARGYRYVDWDAAFMEAVREDWAGLRGAGGNEDVARAYIAERTKP